MLVFHFPGSGFRWYSPHAYRWVLKHQPEHSLVHEADACDSSVCNVYLDECMPRMSEIMRLLEPESEPATPGLLDTMRTYHLASFLRIESLQRSCIRSVADLLSNLAPGDAVSFAHVKLHACTELTAFGRVLAQLSWRSLSEEKSLGLLSTRLGIERELPPELVANSESFWRQVESAVPPEWTFLTTTTMTYELALRRIVDHVSRDEPVCDSVHHFLGHLARTIFAQYLAKYKTLHQHLTTMFLSYRLYVHFDIRECSCSREDFLSTVDAYDVRALHALFPSPDEDVLTYAFRHANPYLLRFAFRERRAEVGQRFEVHHGSFLYHTSSGKKYVGSTNLVGNARNATMFFQELQEHVDPTSLDVSYDAMHNHPDDDHVIADIMIGSKFRITDCPPSICRLPRCIEAGIPFETRFRSLQSPQSLDFIDTDVMLQLANATADSTFAESPGFAESASSEPEIVEACIRLDEPFARRLAYLMDDDERFRGRLSQISVKLLNGPSYRRRRCIVFALLWDRLASDRTDLLRWLRSRTVDWPGFLLPALLHHPSRLSPSESLRRIDWPMFIDLVQNPRLLARLEKHLPEIRLHVLSKPFVEDCSLARLVHAYRVMPTNELECRGRIEALIQRVFPGEWFAVLRLVADDSHYCAEEIAKHIRETFEQLWEIRPRLAVKSRTMCLRDLPPDVRRALSGETQASRPAKKSRK